MECGAKNNYVGKKPQFCSECGSSFNKPMAAKLSKLEYDDSIHDSMSFDLPTENLLLEAARFQFKKRGETLGEIIEDESRKQE